MEQPSFDQAVYEAKMKTMRRDRFLAEREQVVPWARLPEVGAPHYYATAGKGAGRTPIDSERMPPLYFLQKRLGVADEALKDAVYEGQAFRHFGEAPDRETHRTCKGNPW